MSTKSLATYTIEINEYQRQLIVQAMKNLPPNTVKEPNGPNVGTSPWDTPQEEFINLTEMFEHLPTYDDAHTAVHGFCL